MGEYDIYITKEGVAKCQELLLKAQRLEGADKYKDAKELSKYIVEVLLMCSKRSNNIFKCTCGKISSSKSGLWQHVYSVHVYGHRALVEKIRTVKIVERLEDVQV